MFSHLNFLCHKRSINLESKLRFLFSILPKMHAKILSQWLVIRILGYVLRSFSFVFLEELRTKQNNLFLKFTDLQSLNIPTLSIYFLIFRVVMKRKHVKLTAKACFQPSFITNFKMMQQEILKTDFYILFKYHRDQFVRHDLAFGLQIETLVGLKSALEFL